MRRYGNKREKRERAWGRCLLVFGNGSEMKAFFGTLKPEQSEVSTSTSES